MPAQARDLFKSLPSLVDVDIAPEAAITVCGDVHGQFYDLLHIFELNGLPSEDNPYVFNGAGSEGFSGFRVQGSVVVHSQGG